MNKNLFKCKNFKSEIIILSVRWYSKYPLRYRKALKTFNSTYPKVISSR